MPQRTVSSRLEQFRKLNTLRINCLKFVGLWALDSNSSLLSKCLYYVYNKFIITIMLVFIVTLFADICLSFNDLLIVTDDGCILAGIVVVFFKVMAFQIRREQIARLLHDTIDGCDKLCKFTTGDEIEILDKYLQLCRVSFYGFGILGFCLVVALLFFVRTENGELPIRARYPFDTTTYPWHGIGFFVEACAISAGMTAIMSMDSLQLNLCSLFLVQLEILNANFKRCGGDDGRYENATPSGIDKRNLDNTAGLNARYEVSFTSEETSCRNDNYDTDEIRRRGGFAKRFRRSIRNHQRLLAIIRDFNEIFSTGMFVQMLSSTTMICLTGFQAALVKGQSSNTYKFLIYLAAAISQLFYICWMGNEVIHQSASLTESQWLSGWNDKLSVEIGRLLILSMIFSKRELNMKAGVFYVLSMETFTAIMRGSYSFFALLSTMHSEVDQ